MTANADTADAEVINGEAIPRDIARWPRKEAILWLARHTSDAQIMATIMRSTPNSVAATMSLLRKEGHDIPTRTSPRADRIGLEVRSVIPGALIARLKEAAAKRQARPSDLARRILITVLTDGMVDAILDDQ